MNQKQSTAAAGAAAGGGARGGGARALRVSGWSLSPEDLDAAARGGLKLALDEVAAGRVSSGRAVVERLVDEGEPVYGINTGFGEFATVSIEKDKLCQLQRNLIRSHCAGVGAPMPLSQVRRMLCLRINVLAKGYSGISLPTLRKLIAAFNADFLPRVPLCGTVGASGDLAPLSHLALGLMGEGLAWSHAKEKFVPAAEELARLGLTPVELGAKEGLAMINGTQFIMAVGSEALTRAEVLAVQADVVTALTVEVLRGTSRAFDARVHAARRHEGQQEVARRLRLLLHPMGEISELAQSHAGCGRVQDAYTLRCSPQVHGVVHDTVAFARRVLSVEANAGTDNPMVFATGTGGEGEIVSGGNFHGEYPAKLLDYVAIAVHELANISERRIERLCNPAVSGLPAFLVNEGGLNSGFMIAHCTAAALVAEGRVLCNPASADTISTSAAKEDHVSMGGYAARKALNVVETVERVVAIELLAACQALHLLRPLRTTPALEVVAALVRQHVPPLEVDRYMAADIDAVTELVRTGAVLAAARPFMQGDAMDIRPAIHGPRLRPVHRLRVRNAAQVVCVARCGERTLAGPGTGAAVAASVVEGPAGVVVAADGTIAAIGTEAEIDAAFGGDVFESVLDAEGCSVVPGLVDCHTHTVWAGDRTHEFAMKLAGATYMEVHAAGGGINATVGATRAASEDELLRLLLARLRRMVAHGTTTAEVKSGYGLDAETEAKMLLVAERAVKAQPVELVTTALLGHAVPYGVSADEAVEDIISEQLPRVLALRDEGRLPSLRQVDIFCERGIFELDDSRRVLQAGRDAGLAVNFHGDELAPLGGGKLAGELRAQAMSHCEETDEMGIDAMASAGTVAVLLPTTQQILKLRDPPARRMLDSGVPVALATDFNPNCHLLSMPQVMWQACTSWRMTLEEALAGATLNAAASIGMAETVGSLEVGKAGDLLVLNSSNWKSLVYQLGGERDLIRTVVKGGRAVHGDGSD